MLHISETVFATVQSRPVFSINAQLRAQPSQRADFYGSRKRLDLRLAIDA